MRLKELRQQAGLTQAELVKRTGVGQWTVSDLETKVRRAPKVTTLGRLAEVLAGEMGVNAEEILAELAVDTYRQLKARK